MADATKDFISPPKDPGEDELEARVLAQLEMIRNDPDLELRYDVTGDGLVDDAEWALVERMVRLEVETRLRAPRHGSLDVDALGDRFDVIGMLGRGGQGTTHLAIDRTTEEHVVVKELALRGVEDWKAIELFEREGTVLESIDHARIPSYIDAFTMDGDHGHRFFLVQEYVFGQDLESHVRRARWSAEDAIDRLRELAEILAFLHERTPPIIHRDIKPSNIIVAEGSGALHLVDFGAAQSIVAGTQGGSTVVGTSGYVPLEQYAGRAAPASDVYGLGATIVHCVTGLAPVDLPMNQGRLEYEGYVRDESLRSLLSEMLQPFVEDRIPDGRELLRRVDGVESRGRASAALVPRRPTTPAPRGRQKLVETRALSDPGRPWLSVTYESGTRTLTRRLVPSGTQAAFGLVLAVESTTREMKVNYSTFGPGTEFGILIAMCALSPAVPITLLAQLWGPFLASVLIVGALYLVRQSGLREIKLTRDTVRLNRRLEIPLASVQSVTVTSDSIGFHHGKGQVAPVPLPRTRGDVARYLETVLNDSIRRLQQGEDIDPTDVW